MEHVEIRSFRNMSLCSGAESKKCPIVAVMSKLAKAPDIGEAKKIIDSDKQLTKGLNQIDRFDANCFTATSSLCGQISWKTVIDN